MIIFMENNAMERLQGNILVLVYFAIHKTIARIRKIKVDTHVVMVVTK
ncbi:hypothetical protein KIM67_05110 [Flagellimonas sp. 389]|nr:hypothetical protein [Flagellimonas sp. 389]MBS9461779.1 hypothetical protein [Flagellimonas sp. 389]